MKIIKITTPENIEIEYILADLGSRTAAALIDTAIQGVFLLLIGIALLFIWKFSPTYLQKYLGWIAGICIILLALISFGYYIISELSMNGRTIGKKALKLRTIRNNGRALTFKHSRIRNLFRVFIDFFGIGVVLIFFTKEHKRLGDFVASTIVISEKVNNKPMLLDTLININESYYIYISDEEKDLLRNYLERKANFEAYSELRQEMRLYFMKKFENEGILNNCNEFIDRL